MSNALEHAVGAALLLCLIACWSCPALGDSVAVDAKAAIKPLPDQRFELGTSRDPDGHEIAANSWYLLRDGKPWLPVMGEIHFARYPASEWRDELLKMKAGGIDIIATYVFWIHHEEEEGKWDWTGNHSLHDFILTCREVGMPVIVRAGPWCHGEVRNGGLPEWILPMARQLRTSDPAFLAKVKILYEQIAEQLKGLQWKDGGPVIGMQFDNEYGGPAAYLLDLKQIALDAGIDLPIYTRTGWPNLRTPMPYGQILPLYGAYAEGFWDRTMNVMPGNYWQAFLFRDERIDTAVGTDVLGQRQGGDEADTQQYPYLTCELGGGMMTSYHRRILVYPNDVLSVALAKVGSGSNLPGYYMYHGGTNPQGKLTTLEETQSAKYTNSNDMPVKSYDFQAPLGEFGQVRPSYHLLRRLHMFLHDFGPELAGMRPIFPRTAATRNDDKTLRWSVRTNGKSGFIFINNYQRLLPMAGKEGTQFNIALPNGNVNIPSAPVTIPADSTFIWPFNLDLGGVQLAYATAQPFCTIEQQGTRFTFFSRIPEVAPEFLIDAVGATVDGADAKTNEADGRTRIVFPSQGGGATIRAKSADGKNACIVLLDSPDSLVCWKGKVAGKDKILLSRGSLIFDDGKLRVRGFDAEQLRVSLFDNGKFRALQAPAASFNPVEVSLEQTKQPGPAQVVKNGSARVPEMPSDAEFDQAGVWKIKLPAGIDAKRDLILRINYVGDVARIYLGGEFITDNFYNGNAFDFGLKRYAPDVYGKELVLKALPIRKDSPIYLAKEAAPSFGDAESVLTIGKVQILEQQEIPVTVQ